MNMHYFQHVPFEGPGSIEQWAYSKNHTLTSTRWYLDETPPQHSLVDLLIIMGGPMSIHDTVTYPWLTEEKRYIRQAIEDNKPVLGICLGAQLTADVLGGDISANCFKEIGWYPVTRSVQLHNAALLKIIPAEMNVLHWHGETFALPTGSELIASSEGCLNQGFIYNDRVICLQFHLEMTIDTAGLLIENCRHEIREEKFIQPEREMLSEPQRFQNANRVMDTILDYLDGICQ